MVRSAAIRQVTGHLLRLAVGGVFIWAGALKAWDPASFAEAIDRYRMFPYAISAVLALYLPWLELVAGSALLVRMADLPALLTLMSLTVAFTAAVLGAYVRGLDLTCGCFGATDRTPLLMAAVRNGVLLAGMLWLLVRCRSESASVAAACAGPCRGG